MYAKSLQIMIAVTVLAGLFLSTSFGVGYAKEQPPRNPDGVSAVLDDGGTAEVGVEWITDWPGTADDRANWYYSANNLYNELRNAGWIGRFNYGNTAAWERDFKAGSYGGNGLIDTVDLAMIGTHGSSAWDPRYGIALSSVYFSSNNDDWQLSPGEAYRSLGDNDLEWLAFDSCSVLRNDSMWYWREAFNGLHLMLGFANTMYVVYPGDGGVWGDQMQKKGWWIFGHGAKTVTQAWFTAVEDQQPSGVRARVLAEELNSYNDYIWGQGYVSPDYANDGDYWYWDHVAGTPAPLQLTAVPTSLPILNVVPRTVNPDYVMQVGQAFGLTSTQVLAAPDGSAFYMAGGLDDSHVLRVDAFSGGFLFQNLGELWTNPEAPRTLPESERDAAALVGTFMASHGEGLPGARDFFGSQIAPTIELEGPTTGFGEAGIASVAAISPTNYALHYARSVYDPYSMQDISIVGPGSRLNFYIGDNSEVIGMKGGWRDYELVGEPAGLQVAAPVTVPIKTADAAWTDFLADPTITVAQPPQALIYDRTGKPDPTLAYYEQSLSISQTQLIPVWVFVADLYTETVGIPVALQSTTAVTALVASDVNIYVPAADDPLALPQVNITSPAPGTIINTGKSVELDGMIEGGQTPYTYLWTSSVDGSLGTDLTLTSPALHPDLKSVLTANKLTLLVIDANGMNATATVDVLVLTAVYLPLVLKQ